MGSDELLKYFKWDELAANVWLTKYAQEGDITPNDMHLRMAKEFTRVDTAFQSSEWTVSREGLSEYGQTRPNLSGDSVYKLFKDFKYIIPQGSVMSQLGAKSIGSLSNCLVLGQPEDSYGGIFQKDEEMAQGMKRRMGVGIDLSLLRPEGVATSNAAKSSTGAVSFMHRYSNTTREVAQNGRRGALMLSMDIRHPDILDFIKIKRDLTQITGANISVKLNDDFMDAVEANKDYILRFPCNIDLEIPGDISEFPYNVLAIQRNPPTDSIVYIKKIKAREYWDEIIKSAHSVAEPGLMYWDKMVGYAPDGVYPEHTPIGTNPCSEIAMPAYDACRLIALNLFGFVIAPFSTESTFDLDKFYRLTYEAMRLSDDLVELEIEAIYRILEKIENDPEGDDIKMVEYNLWQEILKKTSSARRTGLGFTGLGDVLAALDYTYGSAGSLEFIETIMKVKMQAELDCTIDLAILRGAFPDWDPKLENTYSPNGGLPSCGENEYYQFVWDEFFDQAERMVKYGRRNISVSTLAPTGSLSILAKTTSGIEPLFLPWYKRRKKVNPSDVNARVDFTDQNGDTWQEFFVIHPKFKEWIVMDLELASNEEVQDPSLWSEVLLEEAFNNSPWFGSTANDIPWEKRVEVQSIIQKYISHSISSTINLPSDVSEEVVSNIYIEAWKKGLKGITVYRDGSRSGVMVSTKEKEESFEYKDAPKRPKTLKANVHFTALKGNKFTVIVGLLDNKPYEIFITEEHLEIDANNTITKKRKGLYETKEGIPVTTLENEEVVVITRLISTSLRHGANIKFVVEQLSKIDGHMFTFTKSLARVLKKYIPEGDKSTVQCKNPDCTGDRTNVVFEEGCHVCKDCGESKCG